MKKKKYEPLTIKKQVLIIDDVKSAVEGLKSNMNPIHPYGKHMLEIIDYWFPVFMKEKRKE
jgi:hypothetical protein